MAALPTLSGKEVVSAFENLGWEVRDKAEVIWF
jgi:predicted RNA binding protein YcfA (HicA-like mRNA interferase family)